MAGTVLAVTAKCDYPYVCRADDENNNQPPVMLGSGGGIGDGYEPPSNSTQLALCRALSDLAIASGTAFEIVPVAAGGSMDYNEFKFLSCGGFILVSLGILGRELVCSSGPRGPKPPTSGTPKGRGDFGRSPEFWTGFDRGLRVSLEEPSSSWLPAGVAAVLAGALGLFIYKNPAAGAAILQGAGVMTTTGVEQYSSPSYGYDKPVIVL